MRATWIGAMAVLAAGCGTSAHHSATTHTDTGAVVTPSGQHLSKLSTGGTPKGEQTVRIEVVATSNRRSQPLGKIAIDYNTGLLVLDPPVR